MGMMGKMLASGLAWAAVLGAQGLRVTEVCDVENAPTPEIAATSIAGCSGEAFYQGEKILFQGAGVSVLTRSTGGGKVETVVMDHVRKEWRVLPWDNFAAEMAKEMREGPMGKLGTGIRSEVRPLDQERVIAGHAAKGLEIVTSIDPSNKIAAVVPGLAERVRTSVEIWVARDLKQPWNPEAKEAPGVGAGLSSTRNAIRGMLEIFGQGEVYERLREIPEGLTLEYTLRTFTPMDGKAMVTRSRVTKISMEEIPEKVFAIPEGYRRVE